MRTSNVIRFPVERTRPPSPTMLPAVFFGPLFFWAVMMSVCNPYWR